MPKKSRKLVKRKTGIPGLDEVTLGGLPAHGATLIIGTPGAGKTVLCLQIIANRLLTCVRRTPTTKDHQ